LLVKFLKSYEITNHIRELASSSREIKIAVAYLKKSGIEAIKDALESFIQKKGRLKVLVGLSEQYITDPEALEELVHLQRRLLEKSENRVQIRYYDKSDFHPKLLVFKGTNWMAIILGSSNLTGGGLSRNIEANILIASERVRYGPIKEIDEYFDVIWRKKDGFGPASFTEKILKRYAYNKRVDQQTKKSRGHKKRLIPSTRFPRFKKKWQPVAKASFSLLVDGLSARGERVEAFCTKCERPVKVTKKWVDYWVCDKHRGKKVAQCPSPEEKGEKGGIIKLLIDNAEVDAKLIEKLCSRKGCEEHVDLTNDFYWLVCSRCYDRLDPHKDAEFQGVIVDFYTG